jgi:hypothetical protein
VLQAYLSGSRQSHVPFLIWQCPAPVSQALNQDQIGYYHATPLCVYQIHASGLLPHVPPACCSLPLTTGPCATR